MCGWDGTREWESWLPVVTTEEEAPAGRSRRTRYGTRRKMRRSPWRGATFLHICTAWWRMWHSGHKCSGGRGIIWNQQHKLSSSLPLIVAGLVCCGWYYITIIIIIIIIISIIIVINNIIIMTYCSFLLRWLLYNHKYRHHQHRHHVHLHCYQQHYHW